MHYILDKIGVAGFGLISILLFVVVFTTTIGASFFLKKPFLKYMETLPLEDEKDSASTKNDYE